MNIAVIIPVVQAKMANDVLRQLSAADRRPDQVIIIDNTVNGFVSPIHACQQIRPPQPPLGVNASWTLGFSHLRTDIEIACVINDDIIVSPEFLLKAEMLFDTTLNCGLASTRAGKEEEVINYRTTQNRCYKSKKRSGWAYFIRRSLLDKIPLIPDSLVQFFGDAWLRRWTNKSGYYLYFMADNPVFHYGGTTLKSISSSLTRSLNVTRAIRHRERILYYKLLEEYNNGI